MSADISYIVNVQLLLEGKAANYANVNAVAIVTSDTSVLSSAERWRAYRSPSEVAADFGSYSSVYRAALAIFGTSPNPVSAGGYLIVGYWRAADETVPASAPVVTGGELSGAVTVPALQQISDGTLDIEFDDGTPATLNLTGLDFRSVDTLEEARSVFSDALVAAAIAGSFSSPVVTLSDSNRMVITGGDTGAAYVIGLATDPASGTYVGALLGLDSGSGAVAVAGAASSVLSAEDMLDAATELKAQANPYGLVFLDEPTSADVAALAAWAQANDSLIYDVFHTAANLERDPTNVVWSNKLASYSNYRALYSAANNRQFAATYMARQHVTNFGGLNTALTMNLKTLAVPAEDYSTTEIDKAKRVGLDVYTLVNSKEDAGGVVLCSGANDFSDNRYNLIALKDYIATDVLNLLKTTATKIPQTVRGVNQIVETVERTCERFVRVGVGAPGTWSSPDTFGDPELLSRSVAEKGYYVLGNRLSDQSQADRQARKSPVIQVAFKLAGAIHSVDVIINVNY